MKEKPIVEEFSHYEIHGVVKIEDWSGRTGCIKMRNVKVKDIDLSDHKKVIDFINDNGFGCKQYLAAIVDVFKVYMYGGKIFWYGDEFNILHPNEKVSKKDINAMLDCI